jgi:hypothetical protein
MQFKTENSGGQFEPISGRLGGASASRRASVQANMVQIEERDHHILRAALESVIKIAENDIDDGHAEGSRQNWNQTAGRAEQIHLT